MAAGQQIDDLIATLEQSVESGLAYFQGPGGQSKVMIGHWGPREVLCHLVWWHQATVEGMESVAKGGAPYRIYASVDEMNARAVGRMAGKDRQSTRNLRCVTGGFSASVAGALGAGSAYHTRSEHDHLSYGRWQRAFCPAAP